MNLYNFKLTEMAWLAVILIALLHLSDLYKEKLHLRTKNKFDSLIPKWSYNVYARLRPIIISAISLISLQIIFIIDIRDTIPNAINTLLGDSIITRIIATIFFCSLTLQVLILKKWASIPFTHKFEYQSIYTTILMSIFIFVYTCNFPFFYSLIIFLGSFFSSCVVVWIIAKAGEFKNNKVLPIKNDSDLPIKSLTQDTLNRKIFIDKICTHWNNSKSGRIIGDFGSGKTSLLNLAQDSISRDNKIIIVKVEFWGHSGRDVTSYILDSVIKELYNHFEITSIRTLGNDYHSGLVDPKNYLSILRYITPNMTSLKDMNYEIMKRNLRVVVILEDFDREYPISRPVDDWDIRDREQIHQIQKLADDIRYQSNICLWITLKRDADTLLLNTLTRTMSETIDLDDSHNIDLTTELKITLAEIEKSTPFIFDKISDIKKIEVGLIVKSLRDFRSFQKQTLDLYDKCRGEVSYIQLLIACISKKIFNGALWKFFKIATTREFTNENKGDIFDSSLWKSISADISNYEQELTCRNIIKLLTSENSPQYALTEPHYKTILINLLDKKEGSKNRNDQYFLRHYKTWRHKNENIEFIEYITHNEVGINQFDYFFKYNIFGELSLENMLELTRQAYAYKLNKNSAENNTMAFIPIWRIFTNYYYNKIQDYFNHWARIRGEEYLDISLRFFIDFSYYWVYGSKIQIDRNFVLKFRSELLNIFINKYTKNPASLINILPDRNQIVYSVINDDRALNAYSLYHILMPPSSHEESRTILAAKGETEKKLIEIFMKFISEHPYEGAYLLAPFIVKMDLTSINSELTYFNRDKPWFNDFIEILQEKINPEIAQAHAFCKFIYENRKLNNPAHPGPLVDNG